MESKGANVTQGTVFYHFRTKEQLMFEIVRDLCRSSWESLKLIPETGHEKIRSALDSARSRCTPDSFYHQLFLSLVVSGLLFAVLVWGAAIAFFVLFGPAILVDPDKESFLPVFLLLEAGTAILLYLVVLLYTRIDRSPNAAIKFGVWGAAVGLFLDTFALWWHTLLFPAFSHGQLLSFAIWMVCAYSIYLILPLFVNRRKQTT